jgi:hypothetical protein
MIERLVDEPLVAKAFEPTIPLSTRFDGEDEVQSFVAEYPFERRRPAQHFMLGISVARAGRFLDPVRYEARRAAFQGAEAAREAEFPAIGLRAQSEFFGFGPGGASYGLTFTTRDGRYDVRIVVSSLLPEEVVEPRLDLEGLARGIESRYDSRFSEQGH